MFERACGRVIRKRNVGLKMPWRPFCSVRNFTCVVATKASSKIFCTPGIKTARIDVAWQDIDVSKHRFVPSWHAESKLAALRLQSESVRPAVAGLRRDSPRSPLRCERRLEPSPFTPLLLFTADLQPKWQPESLISPGMDPLRTHFVTGLGCKAKPGAICCVL